MPLSGFLGRLNIYMIHIDSRAWLCLLHTHIHTNSKQISKSSEKNVGRDENLPFSSEFELYREREKRRDVPEKVKTMLA